MADQRIFVGKVFVSFLNDFSEKISNVTLEKCLQVTDFLTHTQY